MLVAQLRNAQRSSNSVFQRLLSPPGYNLLRTIEFRGFSFQVFLTFTLQGRSVARREGYGL